MVRILTRPGNSVRCMTNDGLRPSHVAACSVNLGTVVAQPGAVLADADRPEREFGMKLNKNSDLKAGGARRSPHLALQWSPQGVSPLRKKVRASRGFTLIEMMVVMAVIVIVATVAFIGVGQDTYDSKFRRYTDTIHGMVVRARNVALEEQTLTKVEITGTQVAVFWYPPDTALGDLNPSNAAWRRIEIADVTVFPYSAGAGAGTGLLNGQACNYGVFDGIRSPRQHDGTNPGYAFPTACATGRDTLIFRPDGSLFVAEKGAAPPNSWTEGAGATVVIADESNALVEVSLIEIFPGGLIRKIDGVRP